MGAQRRGPYGRQVCFFAGLPPAWYDRPLQSVRAYLAPPPATLPTLCVSHSLRSRQCTLLLTPIVPLLRTTHHRVPTTPAGDCKDRFVGVKGWCKCFKDWTGEFCAEKRNYDTDEPPMTSSGINDGRSEGGHCKTHKECNKPNGFCVRGKCECIFKAKPPFCGLKRTVALRGVSSSSSASPERTWCSSDSNCQSGGTCTPQGRCDCPQGFTGPWCNDHEDGGAISSSPNSGDSGVGGIHDQMSMLKAKLRMLQLQKKLAALQEGDS